MNAQECATAYLDDKITVEELLFWAQNVPVESAAELWRVLALQGTTMKFNNAHYSGLHNIIQDYCLNPQGKHES